MLLKGISKLASMASTISKASGLSILSKALSDQFKKHKSKIDEAKKQLSEDHNIDAVDSVVVSTFVPAIINIVKEPSITGFWCRIYDEKKSELARTIHFKVYSVEPEDDGGVMVHVKYYHFVAGKSTACRLFFETKSSHGELQIVNLKYYIPGHRLKSAVHTLDERNRNTAPVRRRPLDESVAPADRIWNWTNLALAVGVTALAVGALRSK
jgi:hypothetical protein